MNIDLKDIPLHLLEQEVNRRKIENEAKQKADLERRKVDIVCQSCGGSGTTTCPMSFYSSTCLVCNGTGRSTAYLTR